jgi:predicted homoserine dehydrogenase-like protein
VADCQGWSKGVLTQTILCEDHALRVAVVGLGKMGLLHANILNTLQGVELAAVCDKSGLIQRLFQRALTLPI